MNSNPSDLVGRFGAILSECTNRGMQLPFVVCSASPNGSVIAVRYVEDGEPTVLAEHFERDGFVFPVTTMIIDQAGAAVRVTIEPSDSKFH